jgi:SAM-dependent methyltransferase
MDVAEQVAAYYTRTGLEDKILAALQRAGKDPANLTTADLALVDDLHVGGRETTAILATLMHLRPGMHLLDVGCGLGGPARFFAEQGYSVTGIDLTDEFVRTAESLTRRVGLDQRAHFRQASALDLPFEPATFDGAYMIHVGMNVYDKATLFREAARVLKPGARFTIFDIMGTPDASVEFPLPWAVTAETSYVASVEEYRRTLEAAGLRIEHERPRGQFAIEFGRKMAERATSLPGPLLGIMVLMGEQGVPMLKNVNAAILSGRLEPVELVAVKP